MADRYDLLSRLLIALGRPGVDGLLATADIVEDLLLLGALDGKIVIGSMNRGGLQDAVFELDDRFTGYDAATIAAMRLGRRQDAHQDRPGRPWHRGYPGGGRAGRHRARLAAAARDDRAVHLPPRCGGRGLRTGPRGFPVSWHLPGASLVTPESAGWGFTGLRLLELPSGGSWSAVPGADEMVVVPLAGSCTVESPAGSASLSGRVNVFAGVTDCAYVPRDARCRIASAAGGRFALATARARRPYPFRYIAADQVRVEDRGAGPCARQVHNFGTPDVLEADRLIACEVRTPAGNWSSYPPHKHDAERLSETVLEEIYYFEVADGPAGPGMGYLRAAEVLAEVRLRHVLPERDGRAGSAGVADLRRSRAFVD
jgi:5-deoxy-glucuronate isomerase